MLNHKELRAFDLIIEGKPLNEHRKDFKSMTMKLRFATHDKSLPEKLLACDYSLKWFKENPEQAKALIDRYQRAACRAEQTFWSVRCE
jgi:hypothetical protein